MFQYFSLKYVTCLYEKSLAIGDSRIIVHLFIISKSSEGSIWESWLPSHLIVTV